MVSRRNFLGSHATTGGMATTFATGRAAGGAH